MDCQSRTHTIFDRFLPPINVTILRQSPPKARHIVELKSDNYYNLNLKVDVL